MDEDAMDSDLVRALQDRGIDVITAFDAEMIKADDEQHLRYATERGRVLYSFNKKDFYRIHTYFLEQGQSHAGIVLAQQGDYSVGEQMRRLLHIVNSRTTDQMQNNIEFLSAW